ALPESYNDSTSWTCYSALAVEKASSTDHSRTPRANRTSSFFFNDTATTEIYTLSLHDALPISSYLGTPLMLCERRTLSHLPLFRDRKSTRLNSSHLVISYAVFCLKKKIL